MAVNESGAAISSAGCEVSFPDRDAGCTGVSHFACRDSTVLDSNGAKLKEVGDSAAFDFQRIRFASPVNEYMHDQPDYEDERANDNVPGASGSTIRIQSLWHCFPRKVFDAGTDFSRFFRAMHMKPQGREKSPSTVAIWPMPLPYHPQFDFGKNIDAGEIALRKAVNLQIACLDFLHLRKQSSPHFEICGAVQLNGGQLEVVRRFRRLVAAWQNHPAIGPEELGRSRRDRNNCSLRLNLLPNLLLVGSKNMPRIPDLFAVFVSVMQRAKSLVLLREVIFALPNKLLLHESKWRESPVLILSPF